MPPATPRATNSSDPPRSAPPQQLSIAPVRSGTWQHKLPLFSQLAAHAHRRSRTTRIEMNAFGSPTRMLVRQIHHTGEQRQVNDLQQPARKIEPRGDHRILRWRYNDAQANPVRVVDAHRAATDERPEPREKPKSGRRRKLTRCLRWIACNLEAWNREFTAHGEGERRRSVKVGVFSTRHTRPGQSTEDWMVYAHIVPMTCKPAGRNVRGLQLSR